MPGHRAEPGSAEGVEASAPAAPSGARNDAVPRRDFFRAFAGEAAQAAGAVAEATGDLGAELQENAAALARAAGIGFGDIVVIDVPAGSPAASGHGGPGSRPAVYRSPFRVESDGIVVLDQRRFPESAIEVPCLNVTDAAVAIRDRLAQGPGTIAAVGAYGLARGVRARAASPEAHETAVEGVPGVLAAIYADANMLVGAAPWVVSLRGAIDRLVERAERAQDGLAPLELAEALEREADAQATEEMLGLSRLVTAGTELLRLESRVRGTDRPLRLLVHGPVGSLAFGQLGTVVSAVAGAVAASIPVQVWVAEARPALSGIRTAWELSGTGLAPGLVPDSAVGGLLEAGAIDLALLGALGVTADGAVVDEPGAYAIAALAARHDVPVYVFATRSSLFAPAETAPSAWFDLTPPGLVTGFVTEDGVLVRPFGPALRRLAAAAPPVPPVAPPPPASPAAATPPASPDDDPEGQPLSTGRRP